MINVQELMNWLEEACNERETETGLNENFSQIPLTFKIRGDDNTKLAEWDWEASKEGVAIVLLVVNDS